MYILSRDCHRFLASVGFQTPFRKNFSLSYLLTLMLCFTPSFFILFIGGPIVFVHSHFDPFDFDLNMVIIADS